MQKIHIICKAILIFNLIYCAYSCKKEGVPKLVTFEISNITATSATGGGDITDNGGAKVSASGVCWSTVTEPTFANSTTTDNVGSGKFTSDIKGLEGSTLYHVRAYAINSNGIGYGDAVSFETLNPKVIYGTIADIDGNTYRTLEIGTQIWMAENLKVTRFRSGDNIGTTKIPNKDISHDNEPKYQWPYNGSENNAIKYGRLYTWYTMDDSRGLCPEGWHVPSDDEWTILTDFLGGESNAQQSLKEKGFTIQYGGWKVSSEFTDLEWCGLWWSSSPVENTVPGAIDQIYCRTMVNRAKNVFRTYRYKKSGVSVRCIKD